MLKKGTKIICPGCKDLVAEILEDLCDGQWLRAEYFRVYAKVPC